MKKKHIIIISLVSLILIVSTILICFFSISRVIYSYDKETNTYSVEGVYGFNESYTIADEIDGIPVTSIGTRAFMNNVNIKEIVLGKNITIIGRLAFSGCSKLETIELGSVVWIERNAFEYCTSLSEANINAQIILASAFIGCSSLESITLNNTISIGSYAFAFTAIKKIDIPSSCTSLGNDAFYQCQDLEQIIVHSSRLQNNKYLKSLENVIFS